MYRKPPHATLEISQTFRWCWRRRSRREVSVIYYSSRFLTNSTTAFRERIPTREIFTVHQPQTVRGENVPNEPKALNPKLKRFSWLAVTELRIRGAENDKLKRCHQTEKERTLRRFFDNCGSDSRKKRRFTANTRAAADVLTDGALCFVCVGENRSSYSWFSSMNRLFRSWRPLSVIAGR